MQHPNVYLFRNFHIILLQYSKLFLQWWNLRLGIRQISLQIFQKPNARTQFIQVFGRCSQSFRVPRHERMQLAQLRHGHFFKDTCEAILPVVTMSENLVFQRTRIEKHKLDGDNCFFFLDVVSYFRIPGK